MDFAYSAVHEMTVQAKAITSAFYGRGPRLSYWNGCSTGGRQGLMEAQRYPEDFDGTFGSTSILAGAPVNDRTHGSIWSMSVGVAALQDKESSIPPPKLRVLNEAVVGYCEALDGVKGGLIADPRQCHFDPSTLLCRLGPPA